MPRTDPTASLLAAPSDWTAAVPRLRLAARLLRPGPPIRIVEAPAGSGKTVLLDLLAAQTGQTVIRTSTPGRLIGPLTLWDLPHVPVVDALPEEFPPSAVLILAKRPETVVPGLARAGVYGRVTRLGAEDLLFGAAELAEGFGLSPAVAEEVLRRTGGWPCLVRALAEGDGPMELEGFLQSEILAPLSGPQLVAFQALLGGKTRAAGAPLLAGLPFVDPRRPLPLPPVLQATDDPMRRALSRELASRMTGVPAVQAIAATQAALGDAPAAIAALQSVGAWDAALRTLQEARGPFFVHRFGPAAFDRMLAGFPPEIAQSDELLVLCRAIQAVKRGEIPLTLRILRDRWGLSMDDARSILWARSCFAREVRFFRFLLCTWEDFDVPEDYLEIAYELLAEIPAEDDLHRGSFYNAVLEFYIRARRFAEADHAAVRAGGHYARAGIPILSFYIDLHRGIIHLFQGDPQAARRFARTAAGHLAQTPYDSPGDARLLALLEGCIDFEQGDSQALLRFLSLDLDELAQGEIWPSLIELVLTYGAQALAEQHTILAARSFLDRWRATGERSRQFQALIDIREMVVLQNANRWLEAESLMARRSPRNATDWLGDPSALLTTLHDRDEISLALVRMRQVVRGAPQTAGLERPLMLLLDNPYLTARQRIAAELMRAQVLRRQGRTAEALAQLRRSLSQAAQRGSVAILRDERGLLDDLLSVKRVADPLLQVDPIRRLLRKVQGRDVGTAPRARAHGLTRQEMRILHLLGEGASNKVIAKAIGLSEATVKFHLGNLFRKLGCSSRREAAAAAIALGLIG